MQEIKINNFKILKMIYKYDKYYGRSFGLFYPLETCFSAEPIHP